VVLGERLRVRVVDEEGDFAPDQGVLLTVDGGHTGMLVVRRAEDLAGLPLLVVGELVLDEHRRENAAFPVHERDLFAHGDRGLGVVHGEGDREAPDQAVLEVHRLDDGIVVRLDHEAGQRGEDARGDHLQVREGPGFERYPAQALGLPKETVALLLGGEAVDQLSAVGGYHLLFRGADGHVLYLRLDGLLGR
jgi:hypothetical protein